MASFGAEIAHRVGRAARNFLPPLLLALAFAICEVLISLAHPVFIEIGGYDFPIFMPYLENLTKVLCYIIVAVAFLFFFVGVIFRDYIIKLLRNKAALTKRSINDVSINTSVTHNSSKRHSRMEIRMEWDIIRMERELRDLRELQRLSSDADLRTDFEVAEILLPLFCVIVLLLLLLWPIILIMTIGTISILMLRGTLNLVIIRIVDFVFRGAFRL